MTQENFTELLILGLKHLTEAVSSIHLRLLILEEKLPAGRPESLNQQSATQPTETKE